MLARRKHSAPAGGRCAYRPSEDTGSALVVAAQHVGDQAVFRRHRPLLQHLPPEPALQDLRVRPRFHLQLRVRRRVRLDHLLRRGKDDVERAVQRRAVRAEVVRYAADEGPQRDREVCGEEREAAGDTHGVEEGAGGGGELVLCACATLHMVPACG